MKSSYKLCTSEAEIFYKDDKNTEVVKSQKSNISETIIQYTTTTNMQKK